jgi:hypothetical protein
MSTDLFSAGVQIGARQVARGGGDDVRSAAELNRIFIRFTWDRR